MRQVGAGEPAFNKVSKNEIKSFGVEIGNKNQLEMKQLFINIQQINYWAY